MELKAGYLWLLCGLAGCTMGPDYQKSVPVVPDRWQAEKDASLGLKPVTPEKLKTWWKSFGDSQLDRSDGSGTGRQSGPQDGADAHRSGPRRSPFDPGGAFSTG